MALHRGISLDMVLWRCKADIMNCNYLFYYGCSYCIDRVVAYVRVVKAFGFLPMHKSILCTESS